ncbi:MAG: aminoacyl-tRNA hydrolase [Pseudomonadota bacterium]
MSWKVIVGLGNPGHEYDRTRHNVGFMVLDRLAMEHSLTWEDKFLSQAATWRRSGDRLVLLKPKTWMNLSGRAVQRAVGFYKVPLDDLLVIYDDLDLPVGQLRLRFKGGDGGHRGVRSIIELLGSPDFLRLRIGIGHPLRGDGTSHVLGRFAGDEEADVEKAIQGAAGAVASWLDDGFSRAMNRYN